MRPRRAPAPAPLLLLLLLAPAAARAAAARDCSAGCDLSSNEPACGADGLTYQSRCLAECGGATAVLYAGPCGARAAAAAAAASASGAAAVASEAAANATAAAAAHPVARLFAAAAAAAAGGGARVATMEDMRAFSSEGFRLVGAANIAPRGSFRARKPPPGDAEARARALASNAQIEVFDIRVAPDTGLLYVSQSPLRGRAADLATSGAPERRRGSRPSRAEQAAAMRAAADAEAAAGGAAAAAAATANAATTAGIVAPKIDKGQWAEIRSVQPYPLTAAGILLGSGNNSDGDLLSWHCTATVYGPRVIVTAGHCVYDRDDQTWIGVGTFKPHNYRNSAGKLVAPFGAWQMKHYNYLAGWVDSPDYDTAFTFDVSVITLKTNISGVTGAMGYAWSKAGYAGRLYAAGYPGETVTGGQFFQLAGACSVKDTNGLDGVLMLRAAQKQSGCFTACAIAEAGQSGQAAYEWRKPAAVIHGVLSNGPDTSECGGADQYTEINKINFDFLKKYEQSK